MISFYYLCENLRDMGMVMTTVRLEKSAKDRFDALCKGFGMSANTAFTIFVKKVIEEQRIPFTITSGCEGRAGMAKRNDMAILDKLTGGWLDDSTAEEVANDLRSSRTFGKTRGTIIDY